MVSPKRYLKSFTYCPCGREHILDYIHIELDLRNWYRLAHILRFLFCIHLQHENWISKKECVFFTILVIFWFYLILHNSTIITSPISMHVLKGSSSSNWYPYGQRQWALPNTLMHVCEQPKLLSGRNNTFRKQFIR